MNKIDFQILSEFSETVRESTLKRLKIVPAGKENFRINEKSMSFSDIAKHLIDCDRELINIKITKCKSKCLGTHKSKIIKNRNEYEKLIIELTKLQSKRKKFILALKNGFFNKKVSVESIAGQKMEDIGLLLYKMLDHEAHHRGQISILLKFVL